jgi:thiamine pyrophosphokinase
MPAKGVTGFAVPVFAPSTARTVTEPTPPTAVVVTGGDPPRADLLGRLLLPAERRVVVAADSGVRHAVALGLRVDRAVGDFDSVDPALLDRVEAEGAVVERHPTAKDATDLELALDAAMVHDPARLVVVGGHGGRLDHLLANALVLASGRYAGATVEAVVGDALVSVARPGAAVVVHGRPDDVVTLLPVHGAAHGVRTAGLRYPLRDETLHEGSTRGVSNELLGEEATVRLSAGVLLVVRPQPPPGPPEASRPAIPPHPDRGDR